MKKVQKKSVVEQGVKIDFKKILKMDKTGDGYLMYPGQDYWYELDGQIIKIGYIGIHPTQGSWFAWPMGYDGDDSSGDPQFYFLKQNAIKAGKKWHKQNDM